MMATPHMPCPLEISPEKLSQSLAGGQKLQLLDVRSPGEFAARRIAGSISVPLDQLERRQGELDRTALVVCVCQSGGRSAAARNLLVKLGFPEATSLAGGVSQWSHAGLPLLEDKNAPWALERQVRVAAGSLVLIGVLLGWFYHPAFFGLAGFVGGGLVFAGVTDWCGMGLLLAKAPWNRR
jgi:rhodanese-related sulfurtransferase